MHREIGSYCFVILIVSNEISYYPIRGFNLERKIIRSLELKFRNAILKSVIFDFFKLWITKQPRKILTRKRIDGSYHSYTRFVLINVDRVEEINSAS